MSAPEQFGFRVLGFWGLGILGFEVLGFWGCGFSGFGGFWGCKVSGFGLPADVYRTDETNMANN